MPKFPEPPSPGILAHRPAQIRTLGAGTELWRIYNRSGPHPTTWNGFREWGPSHTARFDHHLPPPRPQPRAILYAAVQGPICVAELFQATRTVDRFTREPWLVGFALVADLMLLDLTGTWPTAAGASMAIGSGRRDRARRWSQAIYTAYPSVQGLWYASSMYANQPAVALYERARAVLPPAPFFHRPLSDPAFMDMLQHAADELGYDLA